MSPVASLTRAAKTQITRLANGLRVATPTVAPSHFAAVGVYVEAGPRDELPIDRGVSHFLSGLAFKSAGDISEPEMTSTISKLGGNIFCTATREAIMYQGAVLHHEVPTAMNLLAHTVLRPNITPDEVQHARESILFELHHMAARPESYLVEMLHAVAYGGQGLGNSVLADSDSAEAMNAAKIGRFRDRLYTADKMVVAGVGLPHERLVELAEEYFGAAPPAPATPIKRDPAVYVGGSSQLVVPKPPPTHLNPTPPLTHVYVAFPSHGYTHDDMFPLSTLQLLMGGGGSFSAGGPGKGMYSRLYTNVLNRYRWIESCQATHLAYLDSSLFSMAGSCVPEFNKHMLNVMLGEMLHMSEDLTPHEIQRAKNQLKSSLLMHLESQVVQLEDVGRQVLADNRRIEPSELVAKIDRVSHDDLVRVATELTSQRPTCVAIGEELSDLADVEATLAAFRAGTATTGRKKWYSWK
ncbi:Mitochondrial-processing peptidase subunit alpha [Allomyces arbusculus]|nr:Mitochondrial-processing peptidase subunit alpha [Allomyces arbusculus]